MEMGHSLTLSGLTYPVVSSKVCHDSFCKLVNSVSLLWVIYCEAFFLNVVSSFSCIPVICPKLVLFLIPLRLVYLYCNLRECILLLFSCISFHSKHAGPEAKGSNPTAGLTFLCARNSLRGHFNHWKVSRKEDGQIFFNL